MGQNWHRQGLQLQKSVTVGRLVEPLGWRKKSRLCTVLYTVECEIDEVIHTPYSVHLRAPQNGDLEHVIMSKESLLSFFLQ